MTTDKLFAWIEAQHGDRPWGNVLAAGTGDHSLRWLRALPTHGIVGVTVNTRVDAWLRPQDQIVTGDWTDPTLLAGRRFDVVIADYLLGAIDGFAPYFQDELFARLAPHVAGRLYVVGQEPWPTRDGQVAEVARVRDACILLAGHRTYREFPREWVVRQLERSGYTVEAQREFPIQWTPKDLLRQLGVARRKLPYFADATLVTAMDRHLATMEARATATSPFMYGCDYVIVASRSGSNPQV